MSKANRKERRESIAQFARGCGVSVSSIRRIENGTSNARLSLIDKIIEYMGISPAELLADWVKARGTDYGYR